jgi:hypothetical protein
MNIVPRSGGNLRSGSFFAAAPEESFNPTI